jgi:hypothetical protein
LCFDSLQLDWDCPTWYPFITRCNSRGHCHSHKVITQRGNRLIAYTKMHSSFHHPAGSLFFSTLTSFSILTLMER